jgi:dihydroxyacetone kinase-like predicted kinase
MVPRRNSLLTSSFFISKGETNMSEKLDFKFDTQLLINGTGLNEDEINKYITEHFKGDCLIAVGDDTLIKIHFHTNEPWQILEYAQSIGDISDVVVENMQRQSDGLKG